jgi:hypothetical protein
MTTLNLRPYGQCINNQAAWAALRTESAWMPRLDENANSGHAIKDWGYQRFLNKLN